MEGPPRRNPREHDKESSIINQKEERERPSGSTGMENKNNKWNKTKRKLQGNKQRGDPQNGIRMK